MLRPEIPIGHVHRRYFMLGLDPFDVGFIDQGIQDVPDPVPVVPEIIFDPQLFKTFGNDLSTIHFRHRFSPFFHFRFFRSYGCDLFTGVHPEFSILADSPGKNGPAGKNLLFFIVALSWYIYCPSCFHLSL
jgi:hypothetical protein